jgi:hypothetical protein
MGQMDFRWQRPQNCPLSGQSIMACGVNRRIPGYSRKRLGQGHGLDESDRLYASSYAPPLMAVAVQSDWRIQAPVIPGIANPIEGRTITQPGDDDRGGSA